MVKQVYITELQSTRKKLIIKFKADDIETTVEADVKIDLSSTE